MGRGEDDRTTRSATEVVIVREPGPATGEDDVRPEAIEVPAIDIDERVAEEAGYGYGV